MKEINNLDLTPYNSYRVRSIARVAYLPTCSDELLEIIEHHGIKNICIIGGGYNLILSKEIYENEVFLIIGKNYSLYKVTGNEIFAQSGIDLKHLSETAFKNGLSGLEYFYDIPGTLGGALVMNAGSKGEDISSLVKELNYYDISTKSVKKIKGKDLGSTYRQSIFQENPELVILDAVLQLKVGIKKDIQEKMVWNKDLRWSKQPREYPNAGSVFKRPKGHFVGQMIEELGIKGYSIGGAKVSEKHAGFIVNSGDATGADIINLIAYIKEKVMNKYNINLEVEQRII